MMSRKKLKKKKKKKLTFSYECVKCSYGWSLAQGEILNHANCPACGSVYYKWTNYEELREKHGWKR